VNIDPRYAEAFDRLGGAPARKGRLDEALGQFRKAVRSTTDMPAAHNDLGALRLQAGRSAEAIQQFERAVEIDPKYAKAENNLGVALVPSGNLDSAMAHFRSAIEGDGRYPEPRYSLGMILYSRGGIAAAMAQWRAGLSADPHLGADSGRMTWVLATCPDASVRNGPEAVALAERLVKLAGRDQPGVLDTLGPHMRKQADSAKLPKRRGGPCVSPGNGEAELWPQRSSRDCNCTTTAHLTGTSRLLRNERFLEPHQRLAWASARPNALLY
jgi:tetratricopeptide (TPR) repeat protein